jgi:small-conductance mechanosensitive channel
MATADILPHPELPGTSGPATAASAGQTNPSRDEGVPILVAGQEIYRMHAALGPFSVEERAATAAKRIHDVVAAPSFDPARIGVVQHDGQTRIAYGDEVLFTVLPEELSDVEREAIGPVAARIADELRAAIGVDRAARAPKRLAISIALTLLVLGVAVLLVRLLFRFGRRTRARFATAKGILLRGVQVRGLELLSADAMVKIAQRGASFVQAALLVFLVYLAMSIVLSLFPWTFPYVRASVGFVLQAVGGVVGAIIGYIPNLFMIALLIVVIRYITRFVSFIFEAVGRGVLVIPGFHRELAAPTNQIARWLVWILGLVVIFPYLPGSGSPAFQGISLFVGLLVSLGSSGAIGNLVSGVVLTYSRSFSVGDRVKIADTVGDVISHNLLSTKLATIKNEEVTIPNSVILGNHIVNYTELAAEKGLILHTTITIGYDAPWRQIHELLIAAARATDGVVANPAPFVFQTSLDDFYVSYQINAYTKEPQRMAGIYSDLHQNIQDRFYDAGVEIMSPHYASLRDGNEVAIPPDKRAPNHTAGAFRVRPIGGGGEAGS